MATIAENRRGSTPGRANKASAGGWIFAVLLVAASIGMFLIIDIAQRFEARIAAAAIRVALDTGTRITLDGTSVLVGIGGTRAFTLTLGIACSVVLILVPFLLVAAGMLASGRASVWRTLPAVIVGATVLLLVNAVRTVLIARLTMDGGLDGFGWAHTVYGSAIALAGLVFVIVTFVAVMSIGRRNRRRTTSS